MNVNKMLLLILAKNKPLQMYKKSYFRSKGKTLPKDHSVKPMMIQKFQSSKELINSICTPKPTDKEKSNNTKLYNKKTIT